MDILTRGWGQFWGRWLAVAVAAMVLFGALAVVAQEEAGRHTVQDGETIESIAEAYDVDPVLLQQVNRLLDDSRLVVGQAVIIPGPDAVPPADTYVVKAGDTLFLIAQDAGTDMDGLMAINGLTDPNRVEVGQVLILPQPDATPTPSPTITPTPTVTPTPLPTALPLPPGLSPFIQIIEPADGAGVSNPFRLIAYAPGGDGQVSVRVLDATGFQIGGGTGQLVTAAANPGAYNSFLGTITFTVPLNSQPGRIQVFTTSPRDGATEQLNSRMVTLQGLGLDDAIRSVGDALAAGNLSAAQTILAGSSFRLAEAPQRGRLLSRSSALGQINRLLADVAAADGQVILDLSADGTALLPDFAVERNLLWVAVSRGWPDDRTGLLTFRRDGDAVVWSSLILVASE